MAEESGPLATLINNLVSGGIGRTLYDVLPHTETGLGVRPQDDATVQLFKQALQQKGNIPKTVQAALRTPGTISVSTGEPSVITPQGLSNLMANLQGQAIGGTTRPTSLGSSIQLSPEQSRRIGTELFADTLPHELVHAMRFNKNLDTRNINIEESVARMGADRPLSSFINRQFGGPTQPMQLNDLKMLNDLLLETLSPSPISFENLFTKK